MFRPTPCFIFFVLQEREKKNLIPLFLVTATLWQWNSRFWNLYQYDRQKSDFFFACYFRNSNETEHFFMFIGHLCFYFMHFLYCLCPLFIFLLDIFFLLICKHETEQDPVGLQGTKVFLCISCLAGNSLHKVSMSFLSSQGRFKELLIKEGGDAETGRRESRNNSTALGQALVSPTPSMNIHSNIFELFCRYWNPYQKKLTVSSHQHVDPRLVGPEDWQCWLPITSPSTNQKNGFMSWSHPPLWTVTIKFITSSGATTQFWGH